MTDPVTSGEFLPCPFCGGDAVWSQLTTGHWTILCSQCRAEGPRNEADWLSAKLAAPWNTRAPTASPADARALIAVCSNTRRASTQSMKGNQWWARDVYHLLGDNKRSLCGRDCADWLTIGPMPTLDDNCCKRCAALSSTPTHVAGEGK